MSEAQDAVDEALKWKRLAEKQRRTAQELAAGWASLEVDSRREARGPGAALQTAFEVVRVVEYSDYRWAWFTDDGRAILQQDMARALSPGVGRELSRLLDTPGVRAVLLNVPVDILRPRR